MSHTRFNILKAAAISILLILGLLACRLSSTTNSTSPVATDAAADEENMTVVAFITPTLEPITTMPSATATVPASTAPAATSTPIATPTNLPPTIEPSPTDTPLPSEKTAEPEATATPIPAAPTAAAPASQAYDFAITELRVLGLGENNGGIDGPGSGRTIFITVLDADGNPLNGAKIVNTAEYPGEALSGDKGPGKAEILMGHEVFRLKVESVSGAPVTSETSHNMSLMEPLPSDIVGKLGGPDYSNAACMTLDNCPLPPYKHYSYVITFKKTHP